MSKRFVFSENHQLNPLRETINQAYRMDETECVDHLLAMAAMNEGQVQHANKTATDLIIKVREYQKKQKGLDSFLFEYDLSTEEGISLMCLAEALLRVPDKSTIDRLIRDKIKTADWQAHLGKSDTLAVNAATWGLMLTGKLLSNEEELSQTKRITRTIKRFVSRSSEPVIRRAIAQSMRILSRQFVMGRTIEEAVKRAKVNEKNGYRYSYDMLGEAARTAEDAEGYFQAYRHAIDIISKAGHGKGEIAGPGISVKLSALHPRYEFAQRERVMNELVPKLFELVQAAKEANIGLTIDAEEADRLDISLDVIKTVFVEPSLGDWEGFGVALQAYQKRGFYVIDYLAELSKRAKRRFKLRLIKGAYWDTEIKMAQMRGLDGYPVFTRKYSTDVSYIACAKKIIANPNAFYPQFATHNAYTVATLLELMGDNKEFEFQCLHGMGQSLYDQIIPKDKMDIPCRIYAPVGSHENLLPYLVRRLLENGANTSFVNRIADSTAAIDELLVEPVTHIQALNHKPHPGLPLPKTIFGEERINSNGIDLSDWQALQNLSEVLEEAADKQWSTAPIVNGKEHFENGHDVLDPHDNQIVVGKVQEASDADIEMVLASATAAYSSWDATPVEKRAVCLEHAAELLEKHRDDFMYLAIREAGKTIADALAEIREAIDFCRYYAKVAREQLAVPHAMQGYTGETNYLSLHGRGSIICISPWNFPLAIFMGQVTAALVAGNCVIAKPAEQTPLIAGLAIRILHVAGIPDDVLHLLPGRGEIVGAALVADQRCNGVIFTGSTETARAINQSLAKRHGPIIPLIAETGGQNAIIVDSSALVEQVVEDVITSSFGGAGQRCSACRVLFVQEDVAEHVLSMLKGAMQELKIGDPALLVTDIGPVIDKDAQTMLQLHIKKMKQQAKVVCELDIPRSCQHGTYVAPCALEIDNLQQLQREVFGPVLHIIRYAAKDLDTVIDSINDTGYGLTLGIHSRIEEVIEHVLQRVNVGNCYVNRNIIGAVVGLQPFGGEGLSGTGPKAGGPHYLSRLCLERSVCIDTTAAGGNASLMSLG